MFVKKVGAAFAQEQRQTHLQFPNGPEMHLEVRFCDNYKSLMQILNCSTEPRVIEMVELELSRRQYSELTVSSFFLYCVD